MNHVGTGAQWSASWKGKKVACVDGFNGIILWLYRPIGKHQRKSKGFGKMR